MEVKYERFLDGLRKPRPEDIQNALGTRRSRLWEKLRAFLGKDYEYQPELMFYGKKYGWCYRYRRKSKTLCVLFPEMKAFTVLTTLGKKEIVQFEARRADFNENTCRIYSGAYQYHDGKWLYKRVLNNSDLRDVMHLIRIKAGRA